MSPSGKVIEKKSMVYRSKGNTSSLMSKYDYVLALSVHDIIVDRYVIARSLQEPFIEFIGIF